MAYVAVHSWPPKSVMTMVKELNMIVIQITYTKEKWKKKNQ